MQIVDILDLSSRLEESANNVVIVHLKPALRLRNISRPFHFGELAIKGRGVKGNLVTKHAVDRVVRAPKEGISDEEE